MPDLPVGGHVVDSSDHAEKISPELAALDAAMAATAHMWGDVRQVHRARILQAALESAAPAIRAAWAADEQTRLSQEIDLEQERCDRLRAEGAAAEREQCAQLAENEAAKARNLPYSGSQHRARSLSELADLIREQP